MTSRMQWYNYCGFIDLEATEDNEPVSDDEEEAEDINDFIDNGQDIPETTAMTSMPTLSHPSDDPTAEQLEEYASAITERARKCWRIEIDSSSNGLDSVESLWVVGSSGPLWRKHTQDHLVSRLKQYKTANHCLIATFALLLVPQRVYLDCHHVNTTLRQLLSSSFAVITSNGALILEEVPIEEEASICTMQQGQPKPQKGDWVVIPTGPYRRDVGCVHQIHDWGAEVFIIPCFYSRKYRCRPQRDQRQHSSLSLWDSNGTLKKLGTMRQICSVTRTQKRQTSEYDHGLLILECRIASLVFATTISTSILALFAQSQHPDILDTVLLAPCPREWHFQVGDIVEVTGNRPGVVCTVNPTGLAIDLDNGAGIHHFPFCR
ncbi:hypothetical protein EDD85DRAFT_789738 [Armillaria nabsnona]|nr:hypothetical protein EDD85DRAFT_789738 [Armillaria nabsnona]